MPSCGRAGELRSTSELRSTRASASDRETAGPAKTAAVTPARAEPVNAGGPGSPVRGTAECWRARNSVRQCIGAAGVPACAEVSARSGRRPAPGVGPLRGARRSEVVVRVGKLASECQGGGLPTGLKQIGVRRPEQVEVRGAEWTSACREPSGPSACELGGSVRAPGGEAQWTGSAFPTAPVPACPRSRGSVGAGLGGGFEDADQRDAEDGGRHHE